MEFLGWIIIGGLAGWVASLLMKGGGSGLLMNIILGIIGGFLGGWVLGLLGLTSGGGLIGSFVTALVGAVLLIFIGQLVTGKR